ncbi:MAG TPA: hypothetical protein PLT92_03135 [Ignavibacteriaceae bacterium]|nr:hypothetical protein [Ignavibacteriaceae bacterium]
MKIEFQNISYKGKSNSGTGRSILRNFNAVWDLHDDNKVVFVKSVDKMITELLFRFITGLDKPDSGKIISGNQEGIRAYIPESSSLVTSMTTLENISLPLMMRGSRKNNIEQLNDIFELTGLTGYEQHIPHPDSRGYHLRVEIARSIAAGAKSVFITNSFLQIKPDSIPRLLSMIKTISTVKEVYFFIGIPGLNISEAYPTIDISDFN